jgi:lipoprotein-releasing system permease protein
VSSLGFIARRYLRAKGRSGSMQTIQRVSMIGVAIGALALVVVLSAFNGLEDLVRSFYNQFDPDLKVQPISGKQLNLKAGQLQELRQIKEIRAVSEVLEEKVFLRYGERESIAMMKGVDSVFRRVSGVESSIRVGNFDAKGKGLLLGIGLAYKLGVYLSEAQMPVQVFVPKDGIPRPGQWQNAYRSERLLPKGVFSIQPDFDDAYAFTSIGFARDLLQADSTTCSSLEIRLKDQRDLKAIQTKVSALLGADFKVRNRDEQQETVFKVLKSEGLMTYLILSLTLGIACFTILGAITISLVEKRRDVFTLWAMGMSRNQVQKLFFRRGMQLTFIGGLIGILLGVVIVILQDQFGLLKLGAGYAVEAYPVRLALEDVILVLLTLFSLGGLSSWLAIRRLKVDVVL